MKSTSYVVNQLIDLQSSTTSFFEVLSGIRLRVSLASQVDIVETDEILIERCVRLYFEVPELPIIYGVSKLRRSVLADEEVVQILDGVAPIGRLFSDLNVDLEIRKLNIKTVRVFDQKMALLLNVSSPDVIWKQYQYWIGHRYIGDISEFFNEESVSRYVLQHI